VVTFQNTNHFGERARAVRRRFFPLAWQARMAVEAASARRSVGRAQRAVAISRSLGATIEEDLGHVPTLRVVLSAPPPLPAPGPLVETTPYVLAVGHDYFHKDWDGLIAAFLKAPDLPRLILVGAPRSERRVQKLRRRIARAGADDRISIRGVIADQTVLAALYSGADCCIGHSQHESFSFTPHEALALGTHVVLSDLPVHREVCPEAEPYYDPDDHDALAAAVRDAVGRSRSGAPVAQSAFSQTWAANARELADLLREAAGEEPAD
jgi:glycosyltransferase involved in cell wall biosynthesis